MAFCPSVDYIQAGALQVSVRHGANVSAIAENEYYVRPRSFTVTGCGDCEGAKVGQSAVDGLAYSSYLPILLLPDASSEVC